MRTRLLPALLALPLLLPAASAGGAQPAMRFVTSRPDPALVLSGAGEPTIGVDPKSGAVLFQAMKQTFRVDARGWTEVTAPTQGGLVTIDPILETDRVTGRTFVSHLLGVCSNLAYTDDAGATWTPVPFGCGVGALADHQTVGAGSGSVYYCAHDGAAANCARSIDGGTTFLPAVPAWTVGDCAGPHGHLTVAPDGTAYLPAISCLDGLARTAVSEDQGLTWRLSAVPGSVNPGDGGNPSVAVGARGTAYFAWAGGDGDPLPHVAVTRDRGRTWSRPSVLGRDRGVANATFVSAVAGDDDRAAVMFLGSRMPGDGQADGFPGTWSVFVSATYDGGRTWRTTEATGPVHRGGICVAGPLCTSTNRQLYEFADAELDRDGRVVVGVSVSCRDSRCSAVVPSGSETQPMLVRQVGGAPLRRAR